MDPAEQVERLRLRIEARSAAFRRFLQDTQDDVNGTAVQVTSDNAADLARIVNIETATRRLASRPLDT